MDGEVAGEKIGRLREGGDARNRLVVEQTFLLKYGDGLEEQRFAVHLHAHEAQIPVALADFLLPHLECSVFVEMTKETAAKFDFADQAAIDFHQTLLPGIHDQRSFHVVKNLRRACGGTKARIGMEPHGDEISGLALALKLERFGEIFRRFRACSASSRSFLCLDLSRSGWLIKS